MAISGVAWSLSLAGGAVVLAGCSVSTQELVSAVEDKPGVVGVEASEVDGDGWGEPPKRVFVTMDGDATEEQVNDVFDEFADEIDDEQVEVVGVTLGGDSTATLQVGQTTQGIEDLVEVLVAARHEPDLRAVNISPYTGGLDVGIDLKNASFVRVREVAQKYRDVLTPDSLSVASEGFLLVWGLDDSPLLESRLAVAGEVDRKFGLTGARVSDYRRMELVVPKGSDLDAVRAFVRSADTDKVLGRVVVSDTDRVNLNEAEGETLERSSRVVDLIRFDPAFRYATFRDGELQIGADSVEDALELDNYFGSGNQPDHLALPVRYIVDGGTEIAKGPGVWIHHYLPHELSLQEEWRSFSLVQTDRRESVQLIARKGLSPRQAAHALASLEAGAAYVVVWPADSESAEVKAALTPDLEADNVLIEGDIDQHVRDELLTGWEAGSR